MEDEETKFSHVKLEQPGIIQVALQMRRKTHVLESKGKSWNGNMREVLIKPKSG